MSPVGPEFLRAEAPPWFGLVAAAIYFLIWAAQRTMQNRSAGAPRPRKQGGARPKAPAGPVRADRRTLEEQGTELWKQLLEGKTPATTRPAAAPPRPVAPAPQPQIVPVRQVGPVPSLAELTAFPGDEGDLPAYVSRPRQTGPRVDAPRPELTATPEDRAVPGIRVDGRREDWRRAVVLREVLGPPVALRRGPDLEALNFGVDG